MNLPIRMHRELERLNERRSSKRWYIRRAHYVNIFRIHEPQTLWFGDGKLFLDGSNGSGKSALMALLIPPAFDRNLEKQRIDTAKSDKKMFIWHLLGNLAAGENERTGYVAVEMVHPENGRVLTFGYGAQAKRGKTEYAVWSFIIEGNLDQVTFLGPNRVPVSSRGMQAQMKEAGGSYYDGSLPERERYQSDLNGRLFGFDSREAYIEYLDSLTELRRPLLGKELSVVGVERFVKQSLPRLSSDIIQAVANTYLETMEIRKDAQRAMEHAEMIENWASAQMSVSLLDTWRKFQFFEDQERRRKREHAAYEAHIEEIASQKNVYKSAVQAIAQATTALAEVEGKIEAVRRQMDALQGVRDLQRSYDEAVNHLNEWSDRVRRAADQVDEAERDARTDADANESAQLELSGAIAALREIAANFVFQFEKLDWPDLREEIRHLDRSAGKEGRLDHFVPTLKQRARTLADLDRAIRNIDAARSALEDAKARLAAAEREREDAAIARNAASQTWKDAAREHVDDIASDLAGIGELKGREFRRISEDIPYAAGVEGIRDYVDELVSGDIATIEAAYNDEITTLRAQEQRAAEDAEEARAALKKLKQSTETTIEVAPAVAAARTLLASEGILAVPLYAVVEPAAPEGEIAIVEEALEDSGFLNRLVIVDGAARDRAYRLLAERNIADALLVETSTGDGNLYRFLAPSSSCGLSPEAVERLLGRIPLHVEPASGCWRTPGLVGFTAGLKRQAESIGPEARAARRERLIREAEARAAATIAAREVVEARRQSKQQALAAFKERVDRVLHSNIRRERLREADSSLQDAERALQSRIEMEKRSVAEVQAKRNGLNSLEAAYKQTRAAHPWLPATLSVDVLEQLRGMYNGVRGGIEKISGSRASVAERQSAAEKAIARQIRADERLEAARKRLVEDEIGRERVNTEVAEIKAALAKELPGYTALEGEMNDLDRMREAIEHKRQDAKDEAGSAEALIRKLDPTTGRYLEELERATSDAARASGAVRANLAMMPDLEAQLAFFDAGAMAETREELRSLADDGTDRTWEQRHVSARNRLAAVQGRAWTHFVDYEPEMDPVTDIPTLRRPDRSERVDIWTLSRLLKETADTKREDISDRMRAKVELILSGRLYSALSDLIRDVPITQARMNDILASVKLQRGQGNLRLTFRPSDAILGSDRQPSAAARRITPAATDRTGASMIQTYDAGKWVLQNEREQDRVIDMMTADLERAYNDAAEGASGMSFEEILTERLDYRNWYAVVVERCGEDGEWTDLQRTHGAGSEGMKSMDLLQPMVAGARLRLLAASESAPLILGMDEVFAQLDGTHATAILQILNALGCDWILATEKGLHPNDVVDGAACYTVRYDNRYFELTPAVWTGERMMTLGEFTDEEIRASQLIETHMVRRVGELELQV